ncbi:1-phosphofructokinase family hexose kinase [Nocardioides sp. ChNu-153]|uniref:1-phosphofructokinase family hexose kinase n=1 Tax=unclassified Nocardioides TaxID=2615069 RepID=UPI002405A98C|nr:MULTISPECIES: 1-phosphofructokinase family hexose kinase [unclassified Nocardioides]MDF9715965.1 1-phosphofructokinase family hexose kinase [Nocardioides sp. ChNu-99]MDN7122958.1 1-phosphofructokinase family hexose kinase [Nocardioides sp. ChNu-153]
MILTLTPNPSVDQTVALTERLARGAVHRVATTTSQPGGKGVNISRAAVAAGEPSIAVLPALREDPFVLELLAGGVDCRPVHPSGPVRVNVTLAEPDGTTTKLNSPGAEVDARVLDELTDVLLHHAGQADWTVLAGSLPPGAPPEWYAALTARLRSRGTRVAVDTSDAPLKALVAALPGSAPELMKPNAEELASFTGADADVLEADPAATAAAAHQLLEQGVGTVLATLGGNGAVLLHRDATGAVGAWHATPPPTTVVSTVGAGDSSLFGYLLGCRRGLPAEQRLALGVAYGSAAAGLPGTTIPLPDQVRPELVAVSPVPFTRGDS